MVKRIKKAVIPAAGFGTRMLPFAKSVPKELIPLVDKPVLQYVAEEAAAAGAEEILIIISPDKEVIKKHFSPLPDLEERLACKKQTALLHEMQKLNELAKISYTYQYSLDGLGDAVRLAADFAGDDPCLVLLGDTVMDPYPGAKCVAGQLTDVYNKYASSVVALAEVPYEKVSSYGIVEGTAIDDTVIRLHDIIEKPAPQDAPGNLAVAARYLLTPAIFDILEELPRGIGNEIQLTDAIKKLIGTENVYGCKVAGKRYDLGTPTGFITANLEFALRRDDLYDAVAETVCKIVEEKNKKK